MPFVQVKVWEGFGEENTKRTILGITKVFTDMGLPEEAVRVLIEEIPKSHWGIGGVPASEKFPEGHK
ncbi:4-oxalocrotonate tautomerase [candidate division KSB1 bacterium]|nr:MAG: 4-oxalocrotonate tautomerase [candidate division KSB1 bacterium]